MEPFLPMYAGPKSRVNDMNKAAPGFFFLAQHAWWNDIILHIFRMIDRDRRVLSILKLSVPPAHTTGFLARLTTLKTATKTATKVAHRLRHEYIAHRNREVALEVRPVPPSSVADVNGAIAAIDDALHFIDHHFTKREPTMYEHLDILGGSVRIETQQDCKGPVSVVSILQPLPARAARRSHADERVER